MNMKIAVATLKALGHEPVTEPLVVTSEVAIALAQISIAVSLRQFLQLMANKNTDLDTFFPNTKGL